MIKTRINNEYKDVIKIFGGDTLQKEITKIWSGEAGKYVYESEVEYTGTLPITITADGNALLDYRIYGNTVQNGTPTPENPIMPNGCGARTENLCDENNINQGYYAYADGQYGNIDTWVNTNYIAIKGNTEYTAKFETIYGSSRWYGFVWYDKDKQYISSTDSGQYPIGCKLTAISPANASFCVFDICTMEYSPLSPSDVIYCMLNLGSTPLPYEPYGYKLPILSNATVTNIYLGENQTTRRIKKLVLTGDENWRVQYGGYTLSTPKKGGRGTILCTHYIPSVLSLIDKTIYEDSANVSIIYDSDYTTLNEFKNYLAAQYATGTPVTVWYVLAEPETGVVNEPLMKIGDYVDTLSMEQAGVGVPTFAGTTVIDYDGELKPSQMYIKYRR